MLPRVKWGLITGGAVAILNLCGGVLMGVVNNCLAIVTVTIATIVAGYFCARQEPTEDAVRAGGIAGAIIEGINLISQLIGGILGGLVGTGILASFTPQAKADPASFTQAVGLGISIIVVTTVVVGLILVLGCAGIGALTAKLAMPYVSSIRYNK